MQTPARRRTSWAVAASVLAHLVLLVAALLQRPFLPTPLQNPAGPPQAIIPILLMPRTPTAAAGGAAQPDAIRLHRRRRRPDESASPVVPLPTPPAARPTETPKAPAITARAAPAVAAQAGPDLSLALRHGILGCANLRATGMTRSERERCDEELGHGVASAPFLPAAIGPRVRAYYDVVAIAKAREPQAVPVVNKAPLPFDPPPSPRGRDHVPGIGCSIPFGPGVKPKKLPHALYLGPCFIEPPKGPLDPEVDIAPP